MVMNPANKEAATHISKAINYVDNENLKRIQKAREEIVAAKASPTTSTRFTREEYEQACDEMIRMIDWMLTQSKAVQTRLDIVFANLNAPR
jgi:hypothetical protein